MRLTLIRGLPGSGKSTLAQQQRGIHLEADMFFMRQGQYCYDISQLQKAHRWCEQQTEKALQHGHSVVVSNTFIQAWQLEPYILLAKRYGATLKLIEARGHYQNIHDVPAEVLAKMRSSYEKNADIIAKIRELLTDSYQDYAHAAAHFFKLRKTHP